jgi:tetratricopeptide (TPR) repeat protein
MRRMGASGAQRHTDALDRVRDLRRLYRYAEARDLLRRLVVEARGGDPSLVPLQLELGTLELEFGCFERADDAFREARAATAAATWEARAARGLVLTFLAQARHDEAAEAAGCALAQARAALAPNSPELVRLLIASGYLATERQDFPRAQAVLDDALDGARGSKTDAERAELLAETLSLLGTVRSAQGRYAEAERALREALALTERAFGSQSIEVAATLNDLGIVFKFAGNFDEARACYERSMALFERALGPDNVALAPLHHNLGGLAHAERNPSAGEPHGRRSVEIRQAALGRDHVNVAVDKAAYAAILADLDRRDEATRLLVEALPILERDLGPAHNEVAVYTNNLAAIHHRNRNYAEAEPLYRRALAIKEANLGVDSPALAVTINNLAVVQKALGRYSDADRLYRRALALLEGNVTDDHPVLASARRNHAKLLAELEAGS